MATTDIGDILFRQLLNMQMYPGSPFTGNIYRDLIMFLVVPTIFIIMILYIMTGRIIPDKKMRIMIGVGAYLFIIASGFYPVFALFAGPYFIFLIFILGLLGFLASHFKVGGGPKFSSSSGPTYSSGEYSEMGRRQLQVLKERKEVQLKNIAAELSEATKNHEASRLEGLRQDRVRILDDIEQIKRQLKIVKWD